MSMSFGAQNEWEAAVYGTPSAKTIDYLRQQYTSISAPLTEFGQRFMASSQEIFNHFNGSQAMQFARNVINRLGGNMPIDKILLMSDVLHFQNAQPVMQRWTMACPAVRTVYHRQQCDGFNESYHDYEPGLVGEEHYDWRRVMNGVVGFEGTERRAVYRTYHEELYEGDAQLTPGEQMVILDGWDSLSVLMALGGADPTSKAGGSL
jgi:hypothetical protein